jgi:hypothetical protein
VLHVEVGSATAERAALRYPGPPLERLRGLVRLDWNAMTEWLEEDESCCTGTIPGACSPGPDRSVVSTSCSQLSLRSWEVPRPG